MTEILPNIFAVEVPETTVGIKFRQSKFVNSTVSFYDQFTNNETLIELSGNCIHLFQTKDCTEEQAATLPMEDSGKNFGYKDYEGKSSSHFYADHALQSLLRSHGLETKKNYLLIKKIA